MVGVPGRSKACTTCKKRKIACSLERPVCKICLKSNRECGGYERERIFVLDARTKEAVTPALPIKLVSLPSKPIAQPPPDLQGTIPLRNAYSSLWTIENPTTRAIYREQIISEFLYSFAPSCSAASWLSVLPSHPHFTSALEASSLAVCTAHLGHLHSSPALIQESLKFYVQALWELQKALWNEKQMYRDETLAACMLLIMYEVTECPDQTITAWQGHMKGCAKLFESRGPESYRGEFSHKLFSSFRQLEIQQALVERRGTFLDSDQWREIPWKDRPKPIWQELMDIESGLATGIAGVYQNPSSSTPYEFAILLLEVVKMTWDFDSRLSSFYERFEAQTDGGLYRTRFSEGFNHSIKISDEPGPPVFPVAYEFPDLATAHTCIIYWALTSILWCGMSKIYDILAVMQMQVQAESQSTIASFDAVMAKPDDTPLSTKVDESPFSEATFPAETSPPVPIPTPSPASSSSSSSTSPPKSTPSPLHISLFTTLPPLGHRRDISAPAKNICQSLEYCMSSPHGMTGTTAAVFPLKVAIESLSGSGEKCRRELEWAKEAFRVIGGKGVKILEHLDDGVEKKAYLPG
ncbi:uncharacterized protein PAC_12497 [Phialocephala subalpina]|uniref:Zn(2)-C6 fungal-type domain-containing protein n=1 Tax=Phialocephala subalpina TaxID=576137 RepID=A0A1L7XC21_9HELO|nr:uncharacterized protein PAC_12497 [Phialocephala subalpina]